MHDLLLAAGPGLFCILLVLGHFLMRGPQARPPLDEAQPRAAQPQARDRSQDPSLTQGGLLQ